MKQVRELRNNTELIHSWNKHLNFVYVFFSFVVSDSCIKMLLVADPQILGNTFDTKLYWPLANFDSDRYV